MALGLAIIMVVLVAVMGAGLLTFASTDLSSVVQVNQGQQASDTADAGVQAARRQLLSDADPDHYDNVGIANSSWAYKNTSGTDQQRVLSFDGKTIKVSIQYLPPVTAPATPNSNQAPEIILAGQTKLESGCRYFKVKSYGESGAAKRGIEAILCASKLDLPTAYYTPKNIDFRGNVELSGVSFFAKGNITKNGSVSVNRSGTALYGDWDTANFNPPSNHNTQGRKTSYPSGTPVVGAGLAAEGTIDDFGTGFRGSYDFDKNTTPKFCRKPASTTSPPCSTTASDEDPNPSGTISYPFDPNGEVDLEFMKEEASLQGNYQATNTAIGTSNYPSDSTDQTVFYVNGEGGTVDYNIPASHAASGTIVVENGNIKMNGNVKFKGIMIITGNGTSTGLYTTSGTPELDGFVIADGDMTIRGDAAPLTISEDFVNRPGFYSVKMWSWRELYE